MANWGRFEPVMTQPAGQGATVEYRFRNGTAVELAAHEIKVAKLLDDVKAYIKSRPQQLDWQKINIGDLGYRLVTENQKQYLGEKVAAWRMEIKPRPQHFDKRVTVATPLQKAGAYLLKAQMVGGNTSYIILWLNDTAIAKKPLDQKACYFVADAVTGAPVPKANVEFFGWQQRWQATNRIEILVKDFAEFTDAEGQLVMDQAAQPQRLPVADHRHDTDAGPLGLPGLHRRLVRAAVRRRLQRDQGLHDHRPARLSPRPGGEVQVLGRLCQVRSAGRRLRRSPASRSWSKSTIPRARRSCRKRRRPTTTAASTASGKLPADATLGVYSVIIKRQGIAAPMNSNQTLGGGTFRVEEYKKPEFEVTVDAPAEPVMLGEKIEGHDHGQVLLRLAGDQGQGEVQGRAHRSQTSAGIRPPPGIGSTARGYWWFACDYDWYPGWHNGAAWRPVPFWWPRPSCRRNWLPSGRWRSAPTAR